MGDGRPLSIKGFFIIAQYGLHKYTQTKPMPRRKVVPQSEKLFSERLNHCLDDTEAPPSVRERAVILSKMVDIPKQLAWSLLDGHLMPDQNVIKKIAIEFEVDPEWLSGNK